MRGFFAGAFAAAFLSVAASAHAQASASPRAPSPSPAARALTARDRDWFERHRDDPAFGDELLRTVAETADSGAAGLLLMDFFASIKNSEQRVEAATWLASLAEFQGRWDLAAQWHATSLEVRERASARLRHAVCLAKAGSLDAALASLQRLPPASEEARGRGRIVKAWCLSAQGKATEAGAEIRAVLNDESLSALHPQALYLAAILEGALTEPSRPSAARDALAQGWPGSPEALALAGGGRVAVRPDPLLLLSTLPAFFPNEHERSPAPSATPGDLLSARPSAPAPSMASTARPATPAPSPSPVARPPSSMGPSMRPGTATASARATPMWPKSYQVGYFSRRENAQRLHDELRAKGYEANLSERKAKDGSPRWVVSVAALKDPETVFLSLSEAGYDVYPLWD